MEARQKDPLAQLFLHIYCYKQWCLHYPEGPNSFAPGVSSTVSDSNADSHLKGDFSGYLALMKSEAKYWKQANKAFANKIFIL